MRDSIVAGAAILSFACLAAGPARAAVVLVSYTGITSTAEGAYVREQDFIAGTTVYTSGPVYDDVVSGTFVIDTARLPAADPFQLDQGFYAFVTTPPAPSFAGSTFQSSGLTPAPSVAAAAALTYAAAGPDFGDLIVSREEGGDTSAVTIDGNGNALVRRTVANDRYVNLLAWSGALPFVVIDGVSIPDFTMIVDGVFGSYHQTRRYVEDELRAGGPDGAIIARTVQRSTQSTRQSAGRITDISVQVLSVPEPATWAMMVAGFALVGTALRRRPGAGASARSSRSPGDACRGAA